MNSWVPGFSALPAAWLFALMIPVIIFYFLKLKRPRVELPSLALWKSVIQDSRVNSPFQKFKRNLLLLLQLLLLACVSLAAMQPFLRRTGGGVTFLPVLIDCSASMAATTETGGESRLVAAQVEVRRLIDGLVPGQQLALIAVHHSARRMTEFTDNRRVLRDALDRLEISQSASRLDDGLRMAEAMARIERVEQAVLISDGNVPPEVNIELPFRLSYQRLPPASANVGITELNARRREQAWDIFARVEATRAASGLVEVELKQDGETVARESVVVTPGGAERLTFKVTAEAASSIELYLKPDSQDALQSDNRAALELPAPRSLTVVCPPELVMFRHVLSALPGVDLYPQPGGTAPPVPDVRITDQPLVTGETALVTLQVGQIPSDLAALVDVETAGVEIVDWQRTHPLLQHVQLMETQFIENPVSRAEVGHRDYEALGYQVIADAKQGPLMLEQITGGRRTYHWLFHPGRSTLPYRVGFPILVTNLLDIASRLAGLNEAAGMPTGVLPAITLEPERAYVVQSPSGERITMTSGLDGTLAGIPADEVGRYDVLDGTQVVRRFGTGLFSPQETSLAVAENLKFPEVSVKTADSLIPTDQPLWIWLAAAGLVFLVLEWWYFQRKPGPLW